MGTYDSGKFKGAKLYTVNQNGAKVTSLLGKVTIFRRGSTISKWRVIHLRVQYVDGALFFQMGLYFFRWLRRSKVDITWFGVLFGFLSKWFGGLGFVSSDLGSTGCISAFTVDFGIDKSFTDGGAHVWKTSS